MNLSYNAKSFRIFTNATRYSPTHCLSGRTCGAARPQVGITTPSPYNDINYFTPNPEPQPYPISLHLLYLHSLYFYAGDVLHPFPEPTQ